MFFFRNYTFIYRRIAKTPRPLLYLEFEYNSRKIAKNILCYLVKLEYNLRKFDWEFNTTSELFSRFYGTISFTMPGNLFYIIILLSNYSHKIAFWTKKCFQHFLCKKKYFCEMENSWSKKKNAFEQRGFNKMIQQKPFTFYW